MECPYCNTINRQDRETCYHCGKDISMLRLISNKARHHYNLALEHAERHRYYEAITELQNALDLDNDLVEARVVLGTVYARVNRPDEARAQWERALEISTPHQKAHRYLAQLRQIRPYRGLLRRLRYFLAAFAVTAALALILLITVAWPNLSARSLDRAWNAYETGNLAAARTLLDQLPRPLSETALELSARSLESTLEREFQTALAAVERLRRQDHLIQAVDRARVFLERQPSPYAREAVEQIVSEIHDELHDSLQRRIARVGDAPIQLDRAMREFARFQQTFPDSPGLIEFRQSLAQAQQRNAALRFDEIRSRYVDSHDIATARAALRALAADLEVARATLPNLTFPGVEEQIATERIRLANAQLDHFFEEARTAIRQGDLVQAAATLRLARDIEPMEPADSAELQALSHELEEARKRQLLNTLRASVADRDWEAALVISDQLTTLTLSAEVRGEVDDLLAAANRIRAVDAYHWLMRRAADIEQGRLDAKQAREVLNRTQRVLDALPMDLYPAALDDALFFAAVANRILGNDVQADQYLERLRHECPKSRYLAVPSIELQGPASEPS
jgi:tetratricopeptide (TPR) repeat protein